MQIIRPTIILLGLSLAGGQSLAQPNYIASETPSAEWPNNIQLADVDGDGLLDLVVPQWTPGIGRQLMIHQQQPDRRFPTRPTRTVDIRPEIVAVSFANVRDEPGDELLLFTASSVFSLSTAQATYAGNIRHLFDWPLLTAVPQRRTTYFLQPPSDLTGNGFVDFLLPGTDGYGYFEGLGPEVFTLRDQFSTENLELDRSQLPPPAGRFSTEVAFNEQDGLVVRVIPRSETDFEDFIIDVADGAADTLLETEQWMPSAVMADMRSPGSADIVFLNIGNDLYGQVNILPREKLLAGDTSLSWQGPVEMEGDFQLLHLNDDGLMDLARIVENGEDWDVHLYRNQGGRFTLMQPDQVMRFSGYDLRLETIDIAGDGRRQLSVSYYTIPVVNAIRNASIVRSQLLYGSASGSQIFNSRPDFRQDDSFSAQTIRGLTSPIHLQSDLDGDGRLDALYLTDAGVLTARRIDTSLRFDAQPFWQYVPSRTIVDFEVRELNGDKVPDILLYHSNTITLLVSAP